MRNVGFYPTALGMMTLSTAKADLTAMPLASSGVHGALGWFSWCQYNLACNPNATLMQS